MDYYKTSKGNWSVVQKYDTQKEAQEVADSLGKGYIVEYLYPYVPPTLQERLRTDLDFGNQLIYIFVEDNRIAAISTTQSESLLLKFRDILGFAQTGAITSIATYLPSIPIDKVFTQERKDKYIRLIADYLSKF
jgi:hypothetical protein